MTRKERKQLFKAYLDEKYKPVLMDSQRIFDLHTSLSRSLAGMQPEYTNVFDVEDPDVINRLGLFIKNPSAGSLAFGRPVQNLGQKTAFLNHYSEFLRSLSETDTEPQEVFENEEDENEFIEGQLRETKFFKRRRNKHLRDECLRRYGYKCYVCQFDFEKVYGPRGHNFIEVHHLNPMANYDDGHSITADQLRPLCSNCHSMIHRDPSGGASDIEAFKQEFEARNNPNDN